MKPGSLKDVNAILESHLDEIKQKYGVAAIDDVAVFTQGCSCDENKIVT